MASAMRAGRVQTKCVWERRFFGNTLVSSKRTMFFQTSSVPAPSLQPRGAGVTGFTRLSLGLGLFSGARVIRGAAASPSPQRAGSVGESVSYPSLDLLTNTQVLDEAKQMVVSSRSGGCVRCCLTESISGEEIFRSDQRFLLQNICSALERPVTNPAIVKQAR